MALSEAQVSESASSPGAVLRAAREAAGFSRNDMAEKLNWVTCYVAAIEEDRYEVFSSKAFATGYLRSYGRYLDVPEDNYLQAHRQLISVAGGTMEREALASVKTPRQVVATSKPGLYLAGLAILGIGGFLWWQQSQPVAGTQPPAGVPAPVAVEPSTESMQSSFADANGTPGVGVSVKEELATAADLAAESVTTEPAGALAIAVASSPDVAPAANTDAAGLTFSFSGECWVEVREGGGELIYANLRQAGDSLQLDGKPPFDVLLGDATAATVVYEGTPVEIKAVTGRKFARFKLGE